MFKLDLRVKRRLSRRNDPNLEAATRDFEEQRLETVKRDHSTCQGCGFSSIGVKKGGGLVSSGYLEVHHIDDDHHNNKSSNLITLCPFCHQVFTLGRRGAVFTAYPIWMPQLSQRAINRLTHLHYFLSWVHSKTSNIDRENEKQIFDEKNLFIQAIGKKNGEEVLKYLALLDAWHKSINDLYELLISAGMQNIKEVYSHPKMEKLEVEIGVEKGAFTSLFSGKAGSQSFKEIYNALITMPEHLYRQRDKILFGVRAIPHQGYFSEQIEYWATRVWLKHNEKFNDFKEKLDNSVETLVKEVKKIEDHKSNNNKSSHDS